MYFHYAYNVKEPMMATLLFMCSKRNVRARSAAVVWPSWLPDELGWPQQKLNFTLPYTIIYALEQTLLKPNRLTPAGDITPESTLI